MKDLLIFIGVMMGVIFCATMLQGCKDVVITDQEWCGDMGPDGATCFHTLSSAERGLSKAEWDGYRFGQLCTTSKFFADNKKVIEQLCHSSGECSFESMEAFIAKTQRRKGRHP